MIVNNKPNSIRIDYLDNLRVLMIIFVVIMHTAITYSGLGNWIYIEHTTLDKPSYYFFLFYLTFTQAYFMSLLFMIAGYFIPKSIEKKGRIKFIKKRIFRLGIPTLIFIFCLNPILLKIVYPNFNIVEMYLHGILNFKFLSWTGPLWFALALLIFTLIYTLFKNPCDYIVRKYSFNINIKNIFGLIIIIALISFTLRLIFPMVSPIMNMQLGNFSAYIFMFLMGIIAYQKNLFDKISYKNAKNWLFIAFFVCIPTWVIIMYFGASPKDSVKTLTFLGGWNLIAFAYAFWESFFCVSIIIAFIGIFKKNCNKKNRLQHFLSDNSFAVYVFHPLILTTITILLKNLHLLPILKFAIVVCLAIPTCFYFVHIIRKIKFIKKLFS